MKKIIIIFSVGLFLGLVAIITYVSIPSELIQEEYFECTNYNNMVCLGGVWRTRTVTNPNWDDSLIATPMISGLFSLILLSVSAVLFIKKNKGDSSDQSEKSKKEKTTDKGVIKKQYNEMEARLQKLKDLLDHSTITKEEFLELKKETLNEFLSE